MLKLFLVVVAIALSSACRDSQWAVFKATHGKTYGDEEGLRRAIWEKNLEQIERHNELYANGQATFFMKENEYSDMTTEEVNRVLNGLGPVNVNLEAGQPESRLYNSVLPATVDWRNKGYVTPIKNQGQCGSCWAFSATGALEGQHFRKSGQLVSLSESNLVDCSGSYGNMGCQGGLQIYAYEYIINNKGIDTESSYPYRAVQSTCKFSRNTVGATETTYQQVTKGSESALQKAAATVGPIAVAIDASHHSFQAYGGGVYSEPSCSSTQLDHGVLVVGYGTENGQDYWLVKNSWGTTWGEEGYIKMTRNSDNQCGIASMATYPIV